jgi:D-alanyl-lipoteichoic acid acyltransferase DltB (MBOAT superfamily)
VIGIGCLLGVRPPENFARPFLATNVSEYWLRVHRSLTLWLTDYVFSPVYKAGLSSRWGRYPMLVACGALMVTMLVSGLWHGTTASFLVFGLIHGLYLIIYRCWDTFMARRYGKRWLRDFRKRRFVQAAGILLTFHAAAFAYLFFDLDLSNAILAIRKLFVI